MRERHPQDSAAQIRDRIRQAAQPGHWVVDPYGALTHLPGDYAVAERTIVAAQKESAEDRAPARAAVILAGLGAALLLGVLSGSVRRPGRKA